MPIRVPRRAPVAVLLASALLAMFALPASAALTAGLDPLTLPAVVSSHSAQTVTGRTILTAADSSVYNPPVGLEPGSSEGEGWHVTLQASTFVYSGPNQGMNIPAGSLAIVSVEAPAVSSGQPVDPVNGPAVPVVSPAGPLDSARTVLHANPGYGAGTYTQGINMSLTIPADARTGTYTSTITTTIAASP